MSATNSATLRTIVRCTGSLTGSATSASTASHIDTPRSAASRAIRSTVVSPDAARRIVDDASEGLVVARVDHQPDIGQHILDLLAVVECGPFINSIRNSSSE